MSLETELFRIATALETIATALTSGSVSVAKPTANVTTSNPGVSLASVAFTPVPVETQVSLPTPVVAPVAAAPAFVAPSPVMQSPVGVPFADAKALLAYVMDAYKTMGPIKGAQIQNVLTSIGVQNINDVKVEQYAAFHAGVEALKVA